MGAFNSNKFISTTLTDYTEVAEHVKQHFTAKGYNVEAQENSFGYFISITKGGIFKAVLGMKTALNIDIKTTSNGVTVEAKIGIFGQQLLPSLIMYFIAWPVLITQISGLVAQAKLDDEAISVIETAIHMYENKNSYTANTSSSNTQTTFCTNCGTSLPIGSKFCSNCGAKQI